MIYDQWAQPIDFHTPRRQICQCTVRTLCVCLRTGTAGQAATWDSRDVCCRARSSSRQDGERTPIQGGKSALGCGSSSSTAPTHTYRVNSADAGQVSRICAGVTGEKEGPSFSSIQRQRLLPLHSYQIKHLEELPPCSQQSIQPALVSYYPFCKC